MLDNLCISRISVYNIGYKDAANGSFKGHNGKLVNKIKHLEKT